MEKNKQYFFMGMYFDTFEEMNNYEAEWQKMLVDHRSAYIMANMLAKDIFTNDVLFSNLTNLEFKQKMNEIFEYAIKILRVKQ